MDPPDLPSLPKRKREEVADSEDEAEDIEEFGSDADFAVAEQEIEHSTLLDEISGFAEEPSESLQPLGDNETAKSRKEDDDAI